MLNLFNSVKKSEQAFLFFFSLFAGILSIWDLSIDLSRDTHFLHILLEGVVVVVSLVVLVKIVSQLIDKERSENNHLKEKVSDLEKESFLLRSDIKKFKQESKNYATGISDLIDVQFKEWGLSKSEKDVALLLIKGLSLKEIASIRNTAEKTVRHQAGIVYEKAQLDGRAQLSAFFLEDILNISQSE